jgi:hypothetical protein
MRNKAPNLYLSPPGQIVLLSLILFIKKSFLALSDQIIGHVPAPYPPQADRAPAVFYTNMKLRIKVNDENSQPVAMCAGLSRRAERSRGTALFLVTSFGQPKEVTKRISKKKSTDHTKNTLKAVAVTYSRVSKLSFVRSINHQPNNQRHSKPDEYNTIDPVQ